MTDSPDPRRGEPHPALLGVFSLVGRTGAVQFTYGYEREDGPVEEAGWWGRVDYPRGITIEVDDASLTGMCDALVQRLLHGGVCKGCDRTSVVLSMRDRPIPRSITTLDGQDMERTDALMEEEGYCGWELVDGEWQRWCGWQLPDPNCSRERLARALAEIRAHPQQIGAARKGRYHDSLSELDFPVITLIDELVPYGDRARPLIERVKNGEFDATPDEARQFARKDPVVRDALFAEGYRDFLDRGGLRG